MTTEEFLESGAYRDFLDIDGVAHPLPLAFTVEPSPVETANIKTMASGRKRKDLIRLSLKFKFTWATAPQSSLNALHAIYSDAASADSVRLYLKKELPTSAGDYAVYPVDLVHPVKYKPRNRVAGLFLYDSVSLELE